MALRNALGGKLDNARMSETTEQAWRLVRDVRIAKLVGISLPEVSDLDHPVVAWYDDLLTAMDAVNRERATQTPPMPPLAF